MLRLDDTRSSASTSLSLSLVWTQGVPGISRSSSLEQSQLIAEVERWPQPRLKLRLVALYRRCNDRSVAGPGRSTRCYAGGSEERVSGQKTGARAQTRSTNARSRFAKRIVERARQDSNL